MITISPLSKYHHYGNHTITTSPSSQHYHKNTTITITPLSQYHHFHNVTTITISPITGITISSLPQPPVSQCHNHHYHNFTTITTTTITIIVITKSPVSSPIEFQGRRCDPNSVGYKNHSQAWGYRMRLLSSIFPKMALATACQFIPHNLDIGGFFPCYKMPFVFNNCTYKDIPFATKCQCRFQ